jgi:glutaconate CoA-transferase subunit B
MVEVFYYYLQGGLIDVGFLGGAQVDRHGNINTTVIGSYENPKVRLPGSGGACEISVHAKKVILILKQTLKNFPETIDFITTPGFIAADNPRRKLGLPGGGPSLVITDLGVYGFSEDTHEMFLKEIHPDISLDNIKETISWDVRISDTVKMTDPPTDEELRIIREDLDPENIYLS